MGGGSPPSSPAGSLAGGFTSSFGSLPASAFQSAPPALSYQRAKPQQFPNPLRTWSSNLFQGRDTPRPRRLFFVFSSFRTQSSPVLPSVFRSYTTPLAVPYLSKATQLAEKTRAATGLTRSTSKSLPSSSSFFAPRNACSRAWNSPSFCSSQRQSSLVIL